MPVYENTLNSRVQLLNLYQILALDLAPDTLKVKLPPALLSLVSDYLTAMQNADTHKALTNMERLSSKVCVKGSGPDSYEKELVVNIEASDARVVRLITTFPLDNLFKNYTAYNLENIKGKDRWVSEDGQKEFQFIAD